jgi:hypothetical protein
MLVAIRSTLSGFIACGSTNPGAVPGAFNCWLPFAGISIQQNCCFVPLHQRIRQVKSSNPKVRHPHTCRKRSIREPACDFHAESIVRQENIADPRDEYLFRFPSLRLFVFAKRLHFARRKEEAVARLSHQPDISPGVVVKNYANMQFPLVVLFNRFDDRDLPLQREVEHITAGVRTQPYSIAAPNLNTLNLDRLYRSLIFEELPFPFVHGASPFTARIPRSAP